MGTNDEVTPVMRLVQVTHSDVQKAISQYLANEGFDRPKLLDMVRQVMEPIIEKAVAQALTQSHVDAMILNAISGMVAKNELSKTPLYTPASFTDYVSRAVRDAINKQFTIDVKINSTV